MSGSAACSALWVSASCQPDQAPVAGGAGADLDSAVEFGGGVVPDHADEREVPYFAAGQALFRRGSEGAVAGQGRERQ